MSHKFRILIVMVMALSLLPVSAVSAQETTLPPYCTSGFQASGAFYFICIPPVGWNGDLVVFAHGYVSPTIPPGGYPFDQLALPDGGPSLIEIVNGLGYAFAASGYSKNGLAVQQGLQDTVDLVQIFKDMPGLEDPNFIYLAGASEGGLITTLGIERFAGLFDGGLATCGPLGDFRRQVNYWGDFRVVFDYFFPGILPPSPVAIPDELMANWETVYAPRVAAAIAGNPGRTAQLLSVTHAPIDVGDPASIQETVLGLLWYSVFATNDGIATLGGQPFDNSRKWYSGSANDRRLNRMVQRFSADPAALANIIDYQTSGNLSVPLVSLHTIGDPIIPYWHIPLYRLKVLVAGSGLHYTNIPVLRYGHCAFNQVEVLVAFALLTYQATGEPLTAALEQLPETGSRAEFLKMVEQYQVWEQ
jgi:hypothetical protein